ncbi:hypothetical protein PPSIR1_08192 [Plesiocystis pacifica SIR-1]|uniref:VWFA domain-containing protein n=1 Tax=Plesiocystis pacifica SIR-1 TaxID=391625 RepID=A6GE13_9BACT|nr:hypothetical protein [Plesiocystis pacifica]EDM75879.1 hypothetical protein PPSIR1_08192 [Plesiocystis pacifica SIR-1]
MYRLNSLPPLVSTLALVLAATACSDSGTGGETFGDGPSTITLGGGDSNSNSGDTDEAGDDNDSNDDTPMDGEDEAEETTTGGVKLDTLPSDEEGQQSADDGAGNTGCAAIDFLFVIDNSGSMGDNQANLIASFPGFIAKIQETIADVDSYHIMVVDTDAYWNDCQIECNFFPFLCVFDGIDGCAGAPSVCDETLGSGVTFPLGDDASNEFCDLAGGQRFITPQEDFNALPQKFNCIASVGTDGDNSERPMAALTQAIGPTLNGPGGCNSGFLRDDAVLVLTIITDEEDTDSPGTAAGWYQNVVAQKIGDGSGVVTLGLINDQEGICPAESQDPAKIREFVNYFPNHIEGSVCEANYTDFFEQAVDLIESTCDEYEPIG